MGIFDFFKKKKLNDKPIVDTTHEFKPPIACSDFYQKDYLGKAAHARSEAKKAVKEKKYDKAWALLHEQKELYAMHANRTGFNAKQILALDSQVHEDMANILRLEGKHIDALTHILYWVCCHNDRPIKKHEQKPPDNSLTHLLMPESKLLIGQRKINLTIASYGTLSTFAPHMQALEF